MAIIARPDVLKNHNMGITWCGNKPKCYGKSLIVVKKLFFPFGKTAQCVILVSSGSNWRRFSAANFLSSRFQCIQHPPNKLFQLIALGSNGIL
ncbi:hypothetical protein FF1_021558 [Malus domestica]